MPLMIKIKDSNGKWRRCGARCYGAKRPGDKCNCVCGSRNHGVGESMAIVNTKAAEGEYKIVDMKPPKRERLGQLTLPMADVEEVRERGYPEG